MPLQFGSHQVDSPTPNLTATPDKRSCRAGLMLRRGLLAGFLCVAGAVPAFAAEFRLPPIVETLRKMSPLYDKFMKGQRGGNEHADLQR